MLPYLNIGTELKKDDYPYNLMLAVGVIPAKTKEEAQAQAEGLAYVLASESFTDRERAVIKCRFEEGHTLAETGELLKIPVKQERVRQIEAKAVRKLRHPLRKYAIAYGLKDFTLIEDAKAKIEELNSQVYELEKLYDEYKKKVADAGMELKDAEKYATLDSIFNPRSKEHGMTVRTYNVLRRAGFTDISELGEKTVKQLSNLRNMGKKSLKEVLEVMERYGIKPKEEAE